MKRLSDALPNIISLLRIPLLFFFCTEDPLWRFCAIALACITDMLDGYLSRKWGLSSRLGAVLDPLADKIFVLGVLAIFIVEDKMTYLQLLAFLGRDFSLVLFTIFLMATGLWSAYRIQAFVCGKATTALQFATLALLSLRVDVPQMLFWSMAIFGALSLVELMVRQRAAVLK